MTIKPIVNKHSSSKSDNNGHNQNQSSVVVDVDGNRQLNVVTSTSSNSGSSVEHETLNLGKRRQKSGAVKRRYHQQSRTTNSKNVEDLNECNENAAKLLNVDTSNSETNVETVDNSGGNSLNTNVSNKTVVELSTDHDTLAHVNNTVTNNSIAEDASGYNSGDEYADLRTVKVSNEEWEQRDMVFARTMEKHDFYIKKMVEDGACLFRAVSEQVYGDQNLHQIVRNQCMDYIKQNSAFYGAYITEDIDQYVNRKRNPSTHGNHLEIRAMSELYHRSIEIYVYHVKPISVFNGSEVTGLEPIRLSYQRGSHYDAILRANSTYSLPPQEIKNIKRMPYELDQRQFKDAVKQSEDTLIEQTMMEDKLKATDFEATNEQIEEQVARESYISWIKENELRNQQQQQQQQQDTKISRISTTSTITSTTSTMSNSNQNVNSLMLNNNEEESNSMFDYVNFTDNQNSFDYSDWDDAQIIAQVMAESQKDYLDQLKKTAVQSHMYDCEGPSDASNTLHYNQLQQSQQQKQQQQQQQQPMNLSMSSNSNSNNNSSSSSSNSSCSNNFTQNQIFAIEDCEKFPKAAVSGVPSSTATATTTTRNMRRTATTVASSLANSAFFSADSVAASNASSTTGIASATANTSTMTTTRAPTRPITNLLATDVTSSALTSSAFFNLEPKSSTSSSQTSTPTSSL